MAAVIRPSSAAMTAPPGKRTSGAFGGALIGTTTAALDFDGATPLPVAEVRFWCVVVVIRIASSWGCFRSVLGSRGGGCGEWNVPLRSRDRRGDIPSGSAVIAAAGPRD